MSCRSNLGKPMKVVHIKTQYVETDACSFKSVVQDLTGKNSTIADSPASSSWVMKVKSEINDAVPPQPRLGRLMSYADDGRPSSAADGHVVLECHRNNINNFNEDHRIMTSKGGAAAAGGGGGSYSFLSRNLSYKEMDRLMKELPPLDDLHKLLSFD